MKKNTTKTTDAISKINISGNVIPPLWYKNIKRNGKLNSQKAHLLAINILADIVYWYSNTLARDEITGNIIEIKKKFAADLLQKSYKEYAEFFGVDKEEVKDAVNVLIDIGAIIREFRTVNKGTLILSNVMFIEPVPSKIEQLTTVDIFEGYGEKTPLPPKNTPTPKNEPYVGCELGGTNTENTTKNTFAYTQSENEIKKTISHIDRPLPKTDIDLKNKILAFLNAENDISEESRRAIFEKIARRRISIPGGLTLPETLAELADWWACRHFAKNRDLNMNYAGFIAAFKTDLDYYNSVQPDEKKQFPQTQKNGQQKTSGSTIRTQYDEEGNVIPRTKTATI